MDNQLVKLFEKIFDRKARQMQLVQRDAARVVAVGDNYLRATVELTNGAQVTLLNKTGEKLYDNDSVWIEYRTNPSSGIIAKRNGEADPLGGSDSPDGVTYVGSTLILTPQQASVYYLSGSEVAKAAISNPDKKVYEYPQHYFVAGGQMCVWVDGVIVSNNDYTSYTSIAKPSDVLDKISAISSTSTNSVAVEASSYIDTYGYSSSGLNCAIKALSIAGGFTAQTLAVKKQPVIYGLVLAVNEISEKATTPCPYGYVTTYPLIAAFDADGECLGAHTALFKTTSKVYIAFKDAAERDAAMNIKARISLPASEEVDVLPEILESIETESSTDGD